MEKHIIIVATHFHPRIGGYALATTNFVKALDRFGNGIRFTVICNDACGNDGDELSLRNGTIIRMPLLRWLPYNTAMFFHEVRLFFTVRRIARRHDSRFILFETMERAVCLLMLTRTRLRALLAVRLHACTETEYFLWGRRFQLRFRALCCRAAAPSLRSIFSTTDFYLNFYRQWYLRGNPLAAAECQFFTIENIAFPPTLPPQEIPRVLAEVGVEKDAYFLTLGRLDDDGLQQKGFMDLVAALFWLHHNGKELPRNFKLLIIGTGRCRDLVTRYAREMGVDDRIILRPSAPNEEIRILQNQSAAVVLVSRFEGASMFALESLAGGAPLIFSAGGGLHSLVLDGENGFLVPPQDIGAIADALWKMATAPPEQRERMRNASKRISQELFAPENIIKKFLTSVELCTGLSAATAEEHGGN
jgi:glycosyltransferase involved in cell wall biosynthesis